jgi:hypothetical protein
MATNNAFLNEFIKMRQALKANEIKQSEKVAKDIKRMPEPKCTSMSLAGIIEDKPSKTKVIEYLTQKRDMILDEESD